MVDSVVHLFQQFNSIIAQLYNYNMYELLGLTNNNIKQQ